MSRGVTPGAAGHYNPLRKDMPSPCETCYLYRYCEQTDQHCGDLTKWHMTGTYCIDPEPPPIYLVGKPIPPRRIPIEPASTNAWVAWLATRTGRPLSSPKRRTDAT